MMSPAYNVNPDSPATSTDNPQVGSVVRVSPRFDTGQLDRSIQIAKGFSRRTAHDFNNIIAVMQGFAAILQNRFKDDPASSEMAGQIAASAEEALKLTSWLSAFANNHPVESSQVDLSAVVNEFLVKSSVDLPSTVQVQPNLGRDLPALTCDEEQLERVCHHLWQNALEALPQGGKISWETTLAQVKDQESGVETPYLRLRVSDSGQGMEESVKESMFDPFFTTKHGKDRGLGLTMVYDAVRAHQGFIDVSSEPAVGTCVDIYWPIPREAPPQAKAATVFEDARKVQKLLVVDDEEIIHVLVGEILKDQPLEVVGATSGEEGIKSFQESEGSIRAVVLDMSLPGMDGLTTFHKLRELDPLVKVIVSSGDPHQQAVHDVMAAGAFGILSKPFRPAHLLEVVQQAFAQ